MNTQKMPYNLRRDIDKIKAALAKHQPDDPEQTTIEIYGERTPGQPEVIYRQEWDPVLRRFVTTEENPPGGLENGNEHTEL